MGVNASMDPRGQKGGDNDDSLTEGSDFVNADDVCSQCQPMHGKKPVIVFCKDCKSYLCNECYTTHQQDTFLRQHTLLDASSIPRRPSCEPCKTGGKDLGAFGFCQNCSEYLCQECFSTHLRPEPCKNHVLLDKSCMPRFKPQQHETKIVRAEHVRDINVRTVLDDRQSNITGMVVVVPGRILVLVDANNGSVKQVAIASGIMCAQLPITKQQLWDITRMSDTRVVVTSPNENALYHIDVKINDNKMELKSKVVVKGQCQGIACINDNLVVTYDKPVKIEILSKSGSVLQTVVPTSLGERLFTKPGYVEVSRDQATIYITDRNKGTVIRLSLADKILSFPATYKDSNLVRNPSGLAVDKTGKVYVCGMDSENIVQLAAYLTKPRQLLQKSDGVIKPQSVCYCQSVETLYVGMADSDVVKVFTLKSN